MRLTKLCLFLFGFFWAYAIAQDVNTTYFNPRDSKAITAQDARFWIQTICQNAPRSFDWYGCKITSWPDIGLILTTRESGAYQPVSTLEGNFVTKGRQELLITFNLLEVDCCVSVAVLLAKVQNRWIPQKVNEINASGCLKFRDGNGLDQLGCGKIGQAFFFDGFLNYLSIWSITFNNDGKAVENELFFAPYRQPFCQGNNSENKPVQYFELSLRNWGRQDIDQDGKPDLVVVLGERQWKSQLEAEACQEATPSIVTNRLVFVLRDLGLTPSEATRVFLQSFNPRIQSYFPKQ